METLMTQQTVSMSEFKRNPASVLRSANRRPVAVLSHNKAAFYMVEPALFAGSKGRPGSGKLGQITLGAKGASRFGGHRHGLSGGLRLEILA